MKVSIYSLINLGLFFYYEIVISVDFQSLGCFSSLPSSFSLNNSYEYQTSSYCASKCRSQQSLFFALYNHGDCYCGNTEPNSSISASSCNAYCNGYEFEMCGGQNAYSVFNISGSSDSGSGDSSVSSGINSGSSNSIGSGSGSTTSGNLISSFGSSQSTGTITANQASNTGSNSGVNVIYSTSIATERGSVIYITTSVTQNGSSATGVGGNNSGNSNESSKKRVGAIIGGVVGGVVGVSVLALLILLFLRRINIKREQERMEKEYQEAIKPVEYDDKLYSSSISENTVTVPILNDADTNNINPFDDNRRISNGSLLDDNDIPLRINNKKLTVVNPDED